MWRDPKGSTRVSCAKGKNFILDNWRPSCILAENKTLKVSWELLEIEQFRVNFPLGRGKISSFATFSGHLGF